MKKSIVIVLGLSFTLAIWGCNVAEPPVDSLQHGIIGQHENPAGNTNPGPSPGTLLKLPRPLLSQPNSVRVTKLVSPSGTTILSGTISYVTERFGTAMFDVKFTVPGGAVSDTTPVTMTIDSSHAVIEFQPEGLQFLKPALLDVTLINLDPFSPREIIKFVYVTSSGGFVSQDFEKITISGNKGNIMLKKGIINHFSAYGFGRLTSEENWQ